MFVEAVWCSYSGFSCGIMTLSAMLHLKSSKSSVIFRAESQNVDLDMQETSGWTNFSKTQKIALVEWWRHTIRRDHRAGTMLWLLLALQVDDDDDDDNDDDDDDALLDGFR